jgi:hypothetical protein
MTAAVFVFFASLSIGCIPVEEPNGSVDETSDTSQSETQDTQDTQHTQDTQDTQDEPALPCQWGFERDRHLCAADLELVCQDIPSCDEGTNDNGHCASGQGTLQARHVDACETGGADSICQDDQGVDLDPLLVFYAGEESFGADTFCAMCAARGGVASKEHCD